MKNLKVTSFAICSILCILLNSCQSSEKKSEESYTPSATADTVSSVMSESIEYAKIDQKSSQDENFVAIARMNLEKTGRKFIRTADLKFKVKNVRSTSENIEDLTVKYQGFITSADLRTNIVNTDVTQISADSSLETKYYSVENTLIIRVPYQKLDSLIRELNKHIDFLDYRVIKAEDVSLSILANSMRTGRLSTYEKRVSKAIDTRGKKLDETVNAEENLIERQNQADENKIQSLNLEDQISYSTVNLKIYQRENVYREVIANYRNIKSYEPSFFSKAGESLKTGWELMEELILFLIKIWFLIAIVVAAYFLYKKYGKRAKK